MRHHVHAGVLVAAGLVLAACSPDSAVRQPLAPTEPSLASVNQCAGGLASDIAKKQKALFTGSAGLTLMDAALKIVKANCPNANAKMHEYLQLIVTYGAPTNNTTRANDLIGLMSMMIEFHDGVVGFTRPAAVLGNTGGAADVGGGGNMETFDGKAGVKVATGTTAGGYGGPWLFTFEPITNLSLCPPTDLRQTGRCYHVETYPDPAVGDFFSPKITVGLCPTGAGQGPTGVSHPKAGFGTELLPAGDRWPHDCMYHTAAIDSWLGRDAGPLGRLLARTYDFLRPQPLHAVDAGESGLLGEFSVVGGVLPVELDDNFDDNSFGDFLNGTLPTVGEPWAVVANSPGYVQVQDGLADLTGKVIVLNQAGGNCANTCPEVSLLGTVLGGSSATLGSFQISWSSVQTKSSAKDAPFVVRSTTGAEIARLSYVADGSSTILKFNNATVGTWTRNVAQHFRITINLQTSADIGNPHKAFLEIKDASGNYQPVAGPVDFVTTGETTLGVVGYVLKGIDAGVVGADNIIVRRRADSNP